MSLFLITAPVLADAPGNNGTVKIHEGSTEDEPIVNNEPHVCTFHLHFFFGDEVQSGDWWIESWPPTGDMTEVLSGSYDATGGEDRDPDETSDPDVHSLPDGHYKLYWEGAENPGGQLEIKHKVFWVACEPAGSESPSESASESPSESPSESASESPSESPSESASESPSESVSESPSSSPSEGELGGNPTPKPGGGSIPDTALGSEGVPAWPFALLTLLSLGGLVYLRLSTETEQTR
ncbi:MAG: hypothetical protein K5924_12480 [Chloroflexi bacterium]|nr:hypothetical protein [Chloroflexota bacterium]